MDEAFPFKSEVFPAHQKINNLRKYHDELMEHIFANCDTVGPEDMSDLLNDYKIEGLTSDDFEGDGLKRMDHIEHDEKLICVKIMIVIYHHYSMLKDYLPFINYSAVISPFICYIEENILKNLFDCAKRLKKEANGPLIIKQFETGLERMENWQLIILHLLIHLQSEIFTHTILFKIDPCFYNSVLVMMTVLKYFSEQKQQFWKDNNGNEWETENFELFNDHLLFWPYLRKFLKSGDLLENEEIDYYNHLTNLFEHCSNLFIECIYNIWDFDSSSCTLIILKKAVNTSATCWDSFISLLKEDHDEVKKMEDLTIIVNEKSRNYGRPARLVKIQILTTIVNSLEYDGYHYKDNAKREADKRYQLLLYFKDFFIENMNREEIGNEDQKSMRCLAMVVSQVITCFNVDLLTGPPNGDFLELVSFTFQKWKEYLVSNNIENRRLINNNFSIYFRKTRKCSDDLLLEMIEAYQINLPNFGIYSSMLRNIGKSCSSMSKTMLESFHKVSNKAFETFFMNDTMEYLENEKYLDEEKSKIHNNNTMACIAIILEIYVILVNNKQFEVILSTIKSRCEDMFKKDSSEANRKLIFAFGSALSKITKTTKNSELLPVLDKLNYYPFLTRFIRFIFAENVIDYEQEKVSDIGSLPLLIGLLCNAGILHNCPFDDNQEEKEKDFIYDFVLPTIIDIVILPNSVIANARIVEAYEKGFTGIVHSCWTLGRIVHNDIIRNGGERSLTILDESLGKIMSIIQVFSLLDIALITEYVEQLLGTIMLFIGKRINIAPHLVKCRSVIYSLWAEVQTNQEERVQLWLGILHFVEYIIDNGCMGITVYDHNFIEDLEMIDQYDLPLSLRIHCKRIIQKMTVQVA